MGCRRAATVRAPWLQAFFAGMRQLMCALRMRACALPPPPATAVHMLCVLLAWRRRQRGCSLEMPMRRMWACVCMRVSAAAWQHVRGALMAIRACARLKHPLLDGPCLSGLVCLRRRRGLAGALHCCRSWRVQPRRRRPWDGRCQVLVASHSLATAWISPPLCLTRS